MNAVVVKAGEGHALRIGDVRMVVKEDGTHTRDALGLAEFEVPLASTAESAAANF
jgi:hypothetical protein